MRILFVVTNLGVGGTQKWVELVSVELAARGHEAMVAVDGPPYTSAQTLRDAGVTVVCHSAPPDGATLTSLLGAFRPHVVHVHVWERAEFYAKLCVPGGTLKAITHHWAPNHDLPAAVLRLAVLKNGYRRWRLLRLARTGFALHIGCCETTARYYRKLYGGDSQVTICGTPNGVRLPAPATSSEVISGPPRFLQVGSLTARKRPDATLRAFQEVKTHFPDAALTFVGGGELLSSLDRSIRALRTPDVALVTDQSTVDEHYARSNILVCPSTVEGLPYVILEAAARGLAMIAAAVGGVPEVVIHGRTGLLFRRGDLKALLSCMHLLAGNVPLRKQLGASAAEAIRDRFSLRQQVDELIECYECCRTNLGKAS